MVPVILKKKTMRKKHDTYWDCGDRNRLLANGSSHHAWSQTDWLTTSKHCLISSVRLLWTSKTFVTSLQISPLTSTMNKISSAINYLLYIHHNHFNSCSVINLTTVSMYCIFTFTRHSKFEQTISIIFILNTHKRK